MCGAEASALTPLLVIRPGLGLNWPVHRHQHLQARVQRSLASAGGRLPDASVDSPGRDEEHLREARQPRGSSSHSTCHRPEQPQHALVRVHGCSPPACQRRKGAQLQVQKTPENPTPPRRGQRGRLVPDENCRQSLPGACRAAFMGCPRPPTCAPRTALCGPGAASRPSGGRLLVWIDLIAMAQALAGHGPASGPASGARKCSGRTLQRPRPWWSSRNACEQFRLKC